MEFNNIVTFTPKTRYHIIYRDPVTKLKVYCIYYLDRDDKLHTPKNGDAAFTLYASNGGIAMQLFAKHGQLHNTDDKPAVVCNVNISTPAKPRLMMWFRFGNFYERENNGPNYVKWEYPHIIPANVPESLKDVNFSKLTGSGPNNIDGVPVYRTKSKGWCLPFSKPITIKCNDSYFLLTCPDYIMSKVIHYRPSKANPAMIKEHLTSQNGNDALRYEMFYYEDGKEIEQ